MEKKIGDLLFWKDDDGNVNCDVITNITKSSISYEDDSTVYYDRYWFSDGSTIENYKILDDNDPEVINWICKHEYPTASKLIDDLINKCRLLTSGEIPICINNERIIITPKIELGGSDGRYYINIKLI